MWFVSHKKSEIENHFILLNWNAASLLIQVYK